MNFRLFILSLLLLSYGSILGHEVIFGHHTDAEINCHKDHSDCCDHHHGDVDYTPCLVDIDPHFGSVQDFVVYPGEGPVIDLDLHINGFSDACQEIIDNKYEPPGKIIPEDYSILFCRSHGLRGPPIA